ncbi:hypothetical protein P4V41_07435 [Fictibacillus nanhaiensis]|uniref:hypothetical protein n=1 Tax=Fictibacillus nanhaiensis TaxID=742169 RepID=UPI002E1A0D1A|nr:hypothetical protein [Fictibacillus nanhaiensis]
MESELKHLLGKKVTKVKDNDLYFEDGTIIEFHPYETYVYDPVCKCPSPKRQVKTLEGKEGYVKDVICIKCDKPIYR